MKMKHYIDSHKGLTGIYVLSLMAIYDQWQNPTAWIYLALHGMYGILWVLKSKIYPDRKWEQPASFGYGLLIWISLSLYWIAPWIITSRGVIAPDWYVAFCVSIYTLGVFFHFVSDMQKYTALQMRPDHLVSDGLFARVRNTNYFGELLIYGGFGLLAMHWLPIAILLVWILFYWLPNMYQKDRSLSRYPEFSEYKKLTKLFIPFLF